MFKAPQKFLKAWFLLLSVAYCQNAYSAEGGGVGPDLDGDGHPDFVIVDFGADGKKGGGDDRLAPYQSGYPYYANDYPNSYYVDTNVQTFITTPMVRVGTKSWRLCNLLALFQPPPMQIILPML